MTKMLRILSALILITSFASAQSNSGEIYGKIIDEKKAGLELATVTASEGGVVKGGAKTDLNGNYKIKPLAPGKYDIKVTYTGYKESILQGINVGNDKRVQIDIQMEKRVDKSATKKEVVIKEYKKKLIDASDPGNKVITSKEVKEFATNNLTDLISMSAGVVRQRSGSALNINGGRTGNTLYMIDGMMISGGRNVGMPPSAVDQMELMTNGLSAKYGNATGGIVAITTKGMTRRLDGNFFAQHSVDGYNNNQMALSLTGPLLSAKRKGEKVPVLGYALNLSMTHDKDNNPAHGGYTRMKPDVLKRIQETPIIPNPNGTGNFVPAAELVTANDFENIRARENGQSTSFSIQSKLDYQPTESVNITFGTNGTYTRSRGWSFINSMFAPEANSISNDYSARGFLRLTQRLGKSSLLDRQDAKKSAISNAYYSLQFNYQQDYSKGENPVHGDNVFNYGYVGKFKHHRSPRYIPRQTIDKISGLEEIYIVDSITFTPGGVNPLLENYTKSVYNDPRFSIRDMSQVQSLLGLRNGDGPGGIIGLWTGPGAQIGSYGFSQLNIAQVNLDASLDIAQGLKNKKLTDPITHNIQFGLGYDQRTTVSYAISGAGLWNIMRQNVNIHLTDLDRENPEYWVGGVKYDSSAIFSGLVPFSPFDTVRYQPIDNEGKQVRIDRELRKKLFGSERNVSIIDIDNLDPSTFSLDMFSAEDMLNNGVGSAVGYQGYDYKGNKLKRQPSFNDFWTKKDSKGDFERPIGAFRPIYMSGYILDKFSYKDILFNIGVRVDRYDANQKVLKDPYSFYGVRKVGDITGSQKYTLAQDPDGEKTAPDLKTFDKDYVVYVDNNQSQNPKIVGYRKGDDWFDPFGVEIADPTILSGLYANGVQIEPWLISPIDSLNSIKGRNFNPNNSFEDYKPQILVAPRVQFTFPISNKSLFYGNYDVIGQIPGGNANVTPDDYFYIRERAGELGNANLRMEKVTKYSLGFQQVLSTKSAVTIETFYQERKNQQQLQQYLLAYPVTYRAIGNRDFSSTKGMTVRLDFRRNGPIRMMIDYTLQFAEGTGSSGTSSRSLLNSGQPNLRNVIPLDFDSRHLFNVSFDYRYEGQNRGPKVGKYHPFENAGLNVAFRSNSGFPYTRSSFATPISGGDFNSTIFVGTINGSRLPWQYDLTLKVDKSLSLGTYGSKKDNEGKVIRAGKPLFVNVYAQVLNALNTRNTLGVYRYTGLGDDDGFLTSPQGLQALSAIQYRQSYTDLYNVRMVNPNNFNNPRRINIGLSFDF